MKNPRIALFAVFVLIVGLIVLQRFAIRSAGAAMKAQALKVEAARVLQAPEGGGARLKFLDGHTLPTEYLGTSEALAGLVSQKTQPLALATGDFDRDGVPDLVSAYSTQEGGLLTLHRGNVASIFPGPPEAKGRWGDGEIQPFVSQAVVISVANRPEFIVTGDFDNDTFLDIVTAQRGVSALNLFPGDGNGGFPLAERIDLPGAVTALTAGEMNRSDGLTDLAVGLVDAEGAQVVIFESWRGALVRTGSVSRSSDGKQPDIERETIALPHAASLLVVASLGADAFNDLAVAVGNELLIVAGHDRKLAGDMQRQLSSPAVSKHVFDNNIVALTKGNFADGGTDEIVLLTQDGSLHALKQGGNSIVSRNPQMADVVGGNVLLAARVSAANKHDDLIMLDQASRQVVIMSAPPALAGWSNGWERVATFDGENEIIAALPMRLNKDVLDDIVFLSIPPALAGRSENALAGVLENAVANGSNQPPAHAGGSDTLISPGVAQSAPQSIFTVNSTGNEADTTPGNGVCLTSANTCTLLAAISEANAHAGADEIRFNIAGTAPFTIAPAAPTFFLPTITDTVTIDATTQPGFSGAPIVELSGAATAVNPRGLEIGSIFGGTSASNTVVRGLVINRFQSDAINLDPGTPAISNVKIEGCYIGTDVTGTIARPNGGGISQRGAINISGTGHTIGGTTAAARNIISGNNGNGIRLGNSHRTTGTTIQGNFIGTDKNGTSDLGNTLDGIRSGSIGGENTTIGGTTAGAGNVISGNGGSGIDFSSSSGSFSGLIVEGNRVGTDVTGNVDLGNDNRGVRFDGFSGGSRIGGTTNAARNIISGNGADGIELRFCDGVNVQGNFIGTKADGRTMLINDRNAVFLTSATRNSLIGGATPVVSETCNAPCTVLSFGSNGVGVNISNANIPNSIAEDAAVVASANENEDEDDDDTGDGKGNSVGAVMGIMLTVLIGTAGVVDLGNDGPTEDDPQDEDDGANSLLNKGKVDFAVRKGNDVLADFLLRSIAVRAFRIDFYGAEEAFATTPFRAPETKSAAESQIVSSSVVSTRFLGSRTVTTDATGRASFTASFPVTLPSGSSVFALVTDLTTGDTSENTAFMPVVNGPTPSPSPSPSPSPTWQPVVLNASEAQIKTWKLDGRTFAYVKLSFPNAGFRVTDFGLPVRSGDDFAADASVERFTGPSVQAITTTAQIYDLGPVADGNYTFTFKNSGTVVKSQAFTVTSAAPPPNPIDNAREFVRQHYRDFLNREADQAGEDFWTDNITKCGDPARRPAGQTEAQCTLRQREVTSGAFFQSPEFQYTGYFVYLMYQGALGRQPKLSEFTPDALFVGNGIVVSGQLSAAKINQNKAALAAEFVNCVDPTKYRCAEFKAIYDPLTNQQFVDKLFQTTGVNASVADRAALVDGLNANPATETRASVVQKVVDGINVISEGNQQFTTTYGQAFYNSEFNRAFVQLEYFGYMKRDPDEAGYAFWLDKLNSFGGDFVKSEMVLAFISSPEYRARFGQP